MDSEAKKVPLRMIPHGLDVPSTAAAGETNWVAQGAFDPPLGDPAGGPGVRCRTAAREPRRGRLLQGAEPR